MAFDKELYQRVRRCLKLFPEGVKKAITEKKMFGGMAFLLSGKMTVGIIGDELVVRIISSKMPEVLNNEFTRPMDFTGKPMKEFVFVAPQGFQSESELHNWINFGIEHAQEKLKLKE